MRIVVPYTLEVLDSVVIEYQESFWPINILFIVLALWLVYSIYFEKQKSNYLISTILGFFWIWIGIVYFKIYYNTINWIGFYIGSFFVIEGLLILWLGVLRQKLQFKRNLFTVILAPLLIVIFPMIQLINGAEVFELTLVGMLPSVTVAFTLIIFLSLAKGSSKSILIIPILWSIFALYWNYLLSGVTNLIFCFISMVIIFFLLFSNKNSSLEAR